MHDADAQLLAEIKEFLKETGIAPSTFGQRALGDPNFIAQMEAKKSRSPSGRTATRVRQFIVDERKRIADASKRAKRSNRNGQGAAATA